MKDLFVLMHVFVFVLIAVGTHVCVYVQHVCFWLMYVHYQLCLDLYYKYTTCLSIVQLKGKIEIGDPSSVLCLLQKPFGDT